MTKQITLTGLKVEAIAISTAWTIGDRTIKDGFLYGCGYSIRHKLPPGEWKILGRANEYPFNETNLFFKLFTGYYEYEDIGKWQSYCAANGLTNELILIKSDTLG